MRAETGDKVRLKAGTQSGVRGIVLAAKRGVLLVQLAGNDRRIKIREDAVTNLSLAARKAWKSMPSRHVGRPKGTRHCDRVSVTLRIDRETWERFRGLEEVGLIEDRTAIINASLRELVGRIGEGEGNAATDH
jgi:uncharacterized protein (DUF4415 family)